jgi:hypothetical protein
MGFTRWGYEFDGPYFDPSDLSEDPGVYLIEYVDKGKRIILDVGESDNVRDRVFRHERKDCWEANCIGRIFYSVAYMLYSSEEERRALESSIRHSENVICGER